MGEHPNPWLHCGQASSAAPCDHLNDGAVPTSNPSAIPHTCFGGLLAAPGTSTIVPLTMSMKQLFSLLCPRGHPFTPSREKQHSQEVALCGDRVARAKG